MQKIWRILTYVSVAIFSFFFFLYLLFPYQTLKEALSIKGSEFSGNNIFIDQLELNLPLGVDAYGVQIISPRGKKMKFNL